MSTTTAIEKRVLRFYDVTLELGLDKSTNVGAALAEVVVAPKHVKKHVSLRYELDEAKGTDPVRQGKIAAAKRARVLAERESGFRLNTEDWTATFLREKLIDCVVERDADNPDWVVSCKPVGR